MNEWRRREGKRKRDRKWNILEMLEDAKDILKWKKWSQKENVEVYLRKKRKRLSTGSEKKESRGKGEAKG